MKVEAIVRFGNEQRSFVIPCGDGKKNFKWLASVASQRFIQSTPNGQLRRRELLCSGNENAQYHTKSITTMSGETPQPVDEYIYQHMNDGDSVIIELTDHININQLSGMPQVSHFAILAHSASQEHMLADASAHTILTVEDLRNQGEGVEDEDSDLEQLLDNEQTMNSFVNNNLASSSSTASLNNGSSSSELKSKIRSQIQFMKLMLKSQLIDEFRINAQVDRHFTVIHKVVQKVKDEEVSAIKQLLIRRWDLLHDIFYSYCSNANVALAATTITTTAASKNNKSNTNTALPVIIQTNKEHATMDSDGFFRFIDDAALFPLSQQVTRTSLVFSHTIKRMRIVFPDDAYHKTDVLDFDAFIGALLFAAQLLYNDSADKKHYIPRQHTAAESFEALLNQYLIPLANKNDSPTILKEAFLSDECLFKIRFHYAYLQAIFDKAAAKSRDIPVSITLQDFAELMYQLGMNGRNGQDLTFATKLTREVRSGSIFGRLSDAIPNEHKSEGTSSPTNEVYLSDSNLVIGDHELTFAEFIEAVARAGYHFYSKPNPLISANFSSGAAEKGTASNTSGEGNENVASMSVVDYLLKGINAMSDLAQGKKKRNQSAANKDGKSKSGTSKTKK